MNGEDGVMVAGGVLVVAFIAWVAVLASTGASTERRCLAAGYREAHVTWNLIQYCSKRVNQTDVVIPLDKAEAREAPAAPKGNSP